MCVAYLLALLDTEEADAAVGVADGEHLAVGPPNKARDWVVEARVCEELVELGALAHRAPMHHELRVSRDEREQVHGRAPLHAADVATEAFRGEKLETLRHCGSFVPLPPRRRETFHFTTHTDSLSFNRT